MPKHNMCDKIIQKKKGAQTDALPANQFLRLELAVNLLDLGVELERMLAEFAPET